MSKKELMLSFEKFWSAWPKSIRKGGKSTCLQKWNKMGLDIQADQIIKHVEWMKTTDAWRKNDGAFIPAPLVYINQQRWDGAEIPEMTVTVNVAYKDPALQKIEEDRAKAAPMPESVRLALAKLRNQL